MARCLCVALALVCLTLLWAPAVADTDPNDVFALQQLQQAWGSAETWTGSDPCGSQWDGVFCTGNRVTSLILTSRGLSGTISPAIGGLSALQILELSFNTGLKGELPTQLGSLTSLTSLSLQSCRFTGTIPASLGNLKNLTYFALNLNRLGGKIPPSLGGLSQLKWFDVSYNGLTGPIPVSTNNPQGLGLDTLPNIQHFHMNDNGFTGSIPPEMGLNAINCVHVLMENNQLTGPIPETFGNMKNLQILSLFNNQLTGHIPLTLNTIVSNGSYPGLQQIRVDGNKLNGTVPVFDGLDQLQYVGFSNNSFDPQPFPSWLNASMNTIQSIYLDGANLIGPLPADLLSYPALQGVFLRNNQINGSLYVPVNLGSDLEYVFLQHNQIASIVPLGNNPKLPEILLAGNPTCSVGGLAQASATVCNTTGATITDKWISPFASNNTCPICPKNEMTLNPIRCQCSYPLIVTLEIRQATFSTIDNDTLWDGAFFGQTYNSLVPLVQSASLTLDPDQLYVQLAFLNITTQKVDVTMLFFPLVGDTLAPILAALITQAFTLQKIAYDSPFKPDIVIQIGPSQAAGGVHHGLGKGAVIGIAVGAGAGLMLIVFLALLAFKLKRKAEDERKKNPFAAWKNVEDGAAPNLKGARCFSFDDIRRLTNNFNDDNVLGEGGYGKVYKGIEAGTGVIVAVKRAQEGSKQGAQEFKNEIELLSRVHHNNLVGLVGFCFEKAEQMLVYEYVPNGTLSEWLRVRSEAPLDWDRRLLIALGAARGLAYLHDNADPPIIHRDVKCSNILLDRNLNAKVADFGLSLLVPDDRYSNGRTIKGTMGYLDPEYFNTSVLTTKSDVYSFGVVLLELLTGRPPIYRNAHITKDVRNRFDTAGMAGVLQVVDPALVDVLREELGTFVQIALVCVEETSLERPSMHEVVKQLEVLVGPKAHLMPGHEASMESKMSRRERRMPLEVSSLVSDDFEPASGQFSQAVSASQLSSFKYSGGFAPMPVQPK